MKLPAKFVEDGLELAKGCTLFGVPLTELTHDELLAACAKGWEAERTARADLYESRRTRFDWARRLRETT